MGKFSLTGLIGKAAKAGKRDLSKKSRLISRIKTSQRKKALAELRSEKLRQRESLRAEKARASERSKAQRAVIAARTRDALYGAKKAAKARSQRLTEVGKLRIRKKVESRVKARDDLSYYGF